jgi:hypothetical protein
MANSFAGMRYRLPRNITSNRSLAVGILKFISARLAAFPAAPDLVPDASILAFAFGVSLISALLFGTLPAVRVSRRDVAAALKGGTAPPSVRFAGYHARDLVVFLELSLAVVLIVVAAMWLNLFAELQRVAPTFPADQVAVAHTGSEHVIPALEAISAIPGVTGVTAGRLAQFGVVFPDVYVPLDPEAGSQVAILARANRSAGYLVRPIEDVLSRSDGIVHRASVLADEKQFVRDQSVFLVRMIGAFGLLALFLAATGVFGVLTQSVSQRTTEFGVRMAMGASPGALLAMVVRREAKLILAAIAAGAIGTVLVTRGLFAELVTVNATDVRMWIAVALLCGGFAAGAVALATRRIGRLDPWTVLRNG